MRNGYGKRRSFSRLIGSVALGTREPTRVCAKTETSQVVRCCGQTNQIEGTSPVTGFRARPCRALLVGTDGRSGRPGVAVDVAPNIVDAEGRKSGNG
jgi:hypothetical protein